MRKRNGVIRLTNYFLAGIASGGFAAWLITSLNTSNYSVSQASISIEIPPGTKTPRPSFAGSAGDADGDGMNDSWEVAHSLDPANPDDASSDFDQDGLTALQEFEQGSNPLGQWIEQPFEIGPDVLRHSSLSFTKFTSSGYVLMTGYSANPSSVPGNRAVLWHPETGSIEVAKPGGVSIYAYDVNDHGEVVGGFFPAGGGNQKSFIWSLEEGFRTLSAPAGMTDFVLAYRINDLGDILLQSSDTAPVVSAVVSAGGTVLTELASSFDRPRLLSLNYFGEMLGVDTNPADGRPKAFLRFPGLPDFDTSLAASYPDLFTNTTETHIFSARMNDFGEFACDYQTGSSWNSPYDFYLFDGDYRSFKKPGDYSSNLLGINNHPQILFQAKVGSSYYNSTYETRLASDGHVVTISDFHPQPPGAGSSAYSLLNDKGEILGYRTTGTYSLKKHPFILRLDQDADGDGYTNLAEFKLRRNPNIVEVPSATTGRIPDLRLGIDTDGDGMPNVWEVTHGLDWEDPADADFDPDRDGFVNLAEFQLGTNPQGTPTYQISPLPSQYSLSEARLTLKGDDQSGYFGTMATSEWESEVFHWTPADDTPGVQEPESVSTHSTDYHGDWGVSLSVHGGGVSGGNVRLNLANYNRVPAYWDAGGLHALNAPGVTSGNVTAISSDGRFVCGTRRIGSSYQLFVHDRVATSTKVVSATGLTMQSWGGFSVHPQGYLMVPARGSGNVAGVAVFKRNSSGNWSLAAHIPRADSRKTFLSKSGELFLAGTVTPSGGKPRLFTWTPAGGISNPGTVGGTEAHVTAMSPGGIFAGHARISDPETGDLTDKAFLSRRHPVTGEISFDLLATPVGEATRSVRSMTTAKFSATPGRTPPHPGSLDFGGALLLFTS